MTEATRRREYLFTVRCSDACSGCGFTQDVPPPPSHPPHTPPPNFLISTLTLQSPGLIKNGKWVIGEEGWPAAGPGSLYCVRGWVWIQPAESPLSMPSCLAQEVVPKSTQVTGKKECEALRLHCVTKIVFSKRKTVIYV